MSAASASLDAAAAEAGLPAGTSAGRSAVVRALAQRDAVRTQMGVSAVSGKTDALQMVQRAPPPPPLPALHAGSVRAQPPAASASLPLSAALSGQQVRALSLRVEGASEASPGRRGADRMEDRTVLRCHRDASERPSLVLLLDGHGGEACAEHCALAIPTAVVSRLQANSANGNTDSSPMAGALSADQLCLDALKFAFATAHSDWLSSARCDDSGCAAIACLLTDGGGTGGAKLHVACAGDCFAMLVRDGEAVRVSTAHVAEERAERAAVEARGGSVTCGKDGQLFFLFHLFPIFFSL